MSQREFIDEVVRIARTKGYKVEVNRNNQIQIDFGNKRLHAGHLARLYPAILRSDANVADLIEAVAPGRPCTHKPMREILVDISSAR